MIHTVQSFFIILLILIKRSLKFLIDILFGLVVNWCLIIFRIHTIFILFTYLFFIGTDII